MTQKIGKVVLIFFLFFLAGCNWFGAEPGATAILDATQIFQTSVVQATEAGQQTQTQLALNGRQQPRPRPLL